MRLIDADIMRQDWMENGQNEYVYDTNAVLDSIDAQPTIEADPVRHGRWECGKPCPVCGRDRFEGLDADIWADWEPPYCPNCGAKLDLEE